MARKHDADGVGSVRGAERPRGGRNAKRGGLPAVGGGGAERDVRQRPPGRELEAGALEVERQLEAGAATGEVFIELSSGLLKNRMIRVTTRSRVDPGALRRTFRPEDGVQAVVRGDQRELADRRAVRGAVQDGFGLHHETSFGVSVSVAHN